MRQSLTTQWSKWPKFVSLHYWHSLRGARSVKKWGHHTKLKSTLVSWSAKIQPKLKKLWKTIKIEQKMSMKPCFLKVVCILFNLDQFFVLQLTKVVFSLIFQIFWHPWHPWGRVNSGDIIDLRFVFDIFVPQRYLPNSFMLFKLKPDITCIDLTSIKSDNIPF